MLRQFLMVLLLVAGWCGSGYGQKGERIVATLMRNSRGKDTLLPWKLVDSLGQQVGDTIVATRWRTSQGKDTLIPGELVRVRWRTSQGKDEWRAMFMDYKPKRGLVIHLRNSKGEDTMADVPWKYKGRDIVGMPLDRDSIELPDYQGKAIGTVIRINEANGEDYRGIKWVTITNKAHFSNCIFLKEANFAGVYFLEQPVFFEDTFSKEVDFFGADPRKGAVFIRSTFLEKVDFSYMCLSDSSGLFFHECHFPDTLVFTRIRGLKNEIGLLDIAFDSMRFGPNGNGYPYNIVLYGSDVSKFHLNYAYFHLLLEDYGGRKLGRDEAISLYEQLLKNFKDRGQQESYEKLDIEYQQYEWRTSPHSLKRWFSWLPDLWWKFGYEKWRVFVGTLVLLIFFTIITALPRMLPFLQREIYPLEALQKIRSPYYNPRRRFWYSLVYTGTLFFALLLKTEHIRFGYKLKQIVGTLYVLLVYGVGIICLTFIVNFILQK